MPVAQNKVVTAQGLNVGQAVCVAAKSTYADNANAVLLFTAGANGSVIYRLTALPRGTVTATQLQLYRSPDGVIMNLIRLGLMPAYAMAQTTIPAFGTAPFADVVDFGYSESVPLRIKAGVQLWAGIGVALAAGIVFDAQGEDL
jgi:hypothetical protein